MWGLNSMAREINKLMALLTFTIHQTYVSAKFKQEKLKNTKINMKQIIVVVRNSSSELSYYYQNTRCKRVFVFYAECKDERCKRILRIGCILNGALPLSCLEWSTFIRAVGFWMT